jgi:hypothetical protein
VWQEAIHETSGRETTSVRGRGGARAIEALRLRDAGEAELLIAMACGEHENDGFFYDPDQRAAFWEAGGRSAGMADVRVGRFMRRLTAAHQALKRAGMCRCVPALEVGWDCADR